MRQPKVDSKSKDYEIIKTVYDDINAVESAILNRDLKEYVVKKDPTTNIPFSINDNNLPKRRIVIYGTTVYEFIKTSIGWKYHQLS